MTKTNSCTAYQSENYENGVRGEEQSLQIQIDQPKRLARDTIAAEAAPTAFAGSTTSLDSIIPVEGIKC